MSRPTVTIGGGGIHESGEIEYPVMTAAWMEVPVRTTFPRWVDGDGKPHGEGKPGVYQLVPVGALVIERDENGEWPEWVFDAAGPRDTLEHAIVIRRGWVRWVLDALEDAAKGAENG